MCLLVGRYDCMVVFVRAHTAVKMALPGWDSSSCLSCVQHSVCSQDAVRCSSRDVQTPSNIVQHTYIYLHQPYGRDSAVLKCFVCNERDAERNDWLQSHCRLTAESCRISCTLQNDHAEWLQSSCRLAAEPLCSSSAAALVCVSGSAC
jgi:hypothetical protein